MRLKYSLSLPILLAGIAIGVSARDKTEIHILVPQSTASVPFLIFAGDDPLPGVSIRVDTFLLHPQALALLLRGEVDLLFTGTSQGWENRLDGSPIVMVNTGVWGTSSMVGKDRGITDFRDLKGKRIALPFPGAPLDFQTRSILAREKIDPERDVTISYGAFTQSVPRLLANQLDAVALPEPLATIAVREQGLARLFTYAQEWGRVSGDQRSPQVSLFTTEAFARANSPLLKGLTDAWRKAAEAAKADPASAARRVAAALSARPEILEEALRNTILEVPSFTENRAKILAYFDEVTAFLPGAKRLLDEGFFFTP
jgi:ABC-type nitrate/sulfonate/bicarbonate transport system substrate-binding protein